MEIATSAFSYGVDVARVGHVITLGGVDNVIDFQQDWQVICVVRLRFPGFANHAGKMCQ